MKLDPTELKIMKDLIQKKKDRPDDVFIKESLNQFMEDIKHKYKITYTNHSFNLETGEIIESRPHKGNCCWYLDRSDGKYKCAITGCNKIMEKRPDD